MSNLQRYTRLIAIGDGNSPGKFYDLLEIDGRPYAVYGKLGTDGKAIEILDFDKQMKAKTSKGYWADASYADIPGSVRNVTSAFGLGQVMWTSVVDPGTAPAKKSTVPARPGAPTIGVALATPLDLADIEAYIASDAWVMEQKLDGHRIRIANDGGQIRYLTRNGDDYTKPISTAVRSIQVPEGWALDGELVGEEYFAFDILHEDIASNPIEDRRSLLEIMALSLPGVNVIPQARTTDEKRTLVEYAIANGLEGVVVKRLGSRYPRGRGNDWLKAKITPTADVVVLDVRDDGKDSARLGIHLGGRTWEIGRCSLIGKPAVKVGDVVEVRYLYVTDNDSNPRLYQPNLLNVRTDKTPEECDGSDFRFVNKQVLLQLPA